MHHHLLNEIKKPFFAPMEAFLLWICTTILVIGTKSIACQVTVFVFFVVFTVFAGRISFCRYMKLISVPMIFVVLASLGVLFTTSAENGQLFFNLGVLSVTKRSLDSSFAAFTRAAGAISCTYYFVLTVKTEKIFDILYLLHLPKILIELMMLIYRFIFVLIDEFRLLSTAQDARLGYSNRKRMMRSLSMMAGRIFSLSMDRVNSLNVAMDARLYNGNIRFLSEKQEVLPIKIILVVFVVLCFTAISLYFV